MYIDKKSYKNILIYYVGYVKIKNSKYIKINSVNLLYFISGKANGYFEEINGNEYLRLVPTNESKEKIKKYEELWSKTRDLIRPITKNTNDYDEKYMKIKFDLDEELPLNKTMEIYNVTIFIRAIFYENNKYYPNVFLDKCSSEL